jgi:hypothetical protein
MGKAKSQLTIDQPDGSSVPAMKVRARLDDRQVGVGTWTISEVRKGEVRVVPVSVGEHLVAGGDWLHVGDDATDDLWFDQTVETDRELAEQVRNERAGI